MKLTNSLILTGALVIAQPLFAEQRFDHFEGKPSPSLPAALSNLAEYNAQLAALLEQDTLSAEDLHRVHQLTYTLENALEKLASEGVRLADLLEEVHLASERGDKNTVATSGKAYLQGSAPLTR